MNTFKISSSKLLDIDNVEIYRKIYEISCNSSCSIASYKYDSDNKVTILNFLCNKSINGEGMCTHDKLKENMGLVPHNSYFLTTNCIVEKLDIKTQKHPNLPIWWTKYKTNFSEIDIANLAQENDIVETSNDELVCISDMKFEDIIKDCELFILYLNSGKRTSAIDFTINSYSLCDDCSKEKLKSLNWINCQSLIYALAVRRWLSNNHIPSIVIPDKNGVVAYLGLNKSELDSLEKIKVLSEDFDKICMNDLDLNADSLGWIGDFTIW